MKFWQILVFPFTILYTQITNFRNFLYKKKYKKSIRFEIMTLNVGNLTVGGTGKTPHIEYLIRLLKNTYQLATLSRGYGRKTKGFILADENSDAEAIGDEPYQFFLKFSENVAVSVGEERILAVPYLLSEKPETQVILLDDAFQHRAINPHLNILLTDYKRLFYKDFPFPSGMLRESRRGANRADIVIVSKCPEDFSINRKQEIQQKIQKYTKENTPVFFTGIKYSKTLKSIFKENQELSIQNQKQTQVVLFSGIAQYIFLEEWVKKTFTLTNHFRFPDHYTYKPENIDKIVQFFEDIEDDNKIILCTEKDYVKIKTPEFAKLFGVYDFFYIPIEIYFLEEREVFEELIHQSIVRHLEISK